VNNIKYTHCEFFYYTPINKGSSEAQLVRLNKTISQYSEMCFKIQQPFLVIGGDQFCALGAWSGVLNGLGYTYFIVFKRFVSSKIERWVK